MTQKEIPLTLKTAVEDGKLSDVKRELKQTSCTSANLIQLMSLTISSSLKASYIHVACVLLNIEAKGWLGDNGPVRDISKLILQKYIATTMGAASPYKNIIEELCNEGASLYSGYNGDFQQLAFYGRALNSISQEDTRDVAVYAKELMSDRMNAIKLGWQSQCYKDLDF